MNLRKILMPVAALAVGIMMMGVEECDMEDTNKSPLDGLLDFDESPQKGAISIHEIIKHPRGIEQEQSVPSYFGPDITISRLPLLYSKEITKVTMIPRPDDPGYYDIKIKMTGRGRKMWIGLSLNNKGKYVAFLIDGMHYLSFKPRLLYDDVTDEIVIDGKFDQATAMELQNNGAKNYKKANK